MADGTTTIDDTEIEKFSAMAARWWDPFGPFKPLHKFNPVRLSYLRDTICEKFDRDRMARRPLEGLKLLDVGCGGGLVAEPMARLGAEVTGIDAAHKNIRVAEIHAAETGVDVTYRNTSVETLVEAGEERFDVVLTLEVVEHVADVDLFLRKCAALVRPGGLVAVATINRTLKALMTAKIGAEYVLRWLPAGTHDPRKFVKPEEIVRPLEGAALDIGDRKGFSYLPLLDSWRVTDDLSVNYIVTASRPDH